MKRRKKLWCHAVIASMVLTSFSPAIGTKAAGNERVQTTYTWEDHDRQLEFPADKTQVQSNSSQSGYGPERMVDGNNDTRWEASWSNAPEQVELMIGTSSGEAEYFTGIKYISRLDNNISGSMSKYKIYKSEDGASWQEIPNMEADIIQKLGTFYFIFDEPVKAKSIKIESDVKAVSEMRLLYIPTEKEDYTALKAEAQALRDEAGSRNGEDIGLWRTASLEAFDEGMRIVEAEGEPDSEEEILLVNRQLLELYSNLKRAQLAETTTLNQELTQAQTLLNAATAGTSPLTYRTEDIEAFREIVEKVKETADNGAAATGAVQDARKLLEDGLFRFKLAQIKPDISYTGNANTSLEYLMDNLTESHFQGSGTGENVYLELDYQTELEFLSLEFQTWWATVQNISKIKVECRDVQGNWNPVDDGKEYTMNWSTNTSESESKTVTFDTPAKGTAIRIYILQASNAYVIDELSVGVSVSEGDVSVVLDKESLTLAEGESGKLTATVLPQHVFNKNVTFMSSREEVLKVSADGTLTAVGLPEGSGQETVIVTVTTEYGAKTAQCLVTVVAKAAEESDKQDTQNRLKNAKKLAEAAKEEDYQTGAIDSFQNALSEIEEKLNGNVTVGGLAKIDADIKQASGAFEEASLIPVRETKNLIDRITGEGSSERFILETIPADEETGNDVYEVGWDVEEKKPVLRGNDGVSLATAYNYYLKYFAYLDFPYVGACDLKLPEEMPVVDEEIRIVFPYEYRHYFNENCEYKYTADLYGEEEWQHRIDWMAMNGFNMFLLDLGEHAIWYNAREELGLSDAAVNELQHYSSGTEQYYGEYEISIEAIEQEGELAKKVTEMAFKAGMEPEVRPFVGQVPFMFPEQHEDYYGSTSQAKMTIELEGSVFDGMLLYSAARWINLPQGVFISPEVAAADAGKAAEMQEKFVQISDIYYKSLMSTLGYDAWGRTPAYVYKDLVGEQGFVVQHEAFPQKVLGEMSEQLMKLNPDAVWMQTSWRYQSWLPQYYRDGSLMFVDLSAENRPKWNSNNEFGGTSWLWSMLFNFGGNSGMEGDLKGVAADVLAAKENSSYMKGVSISPEGGDTNPALYAMMAEMTWRSEAPDMEQWVQDYIKRRYGVENYERAKDELDGAWETLCSTVYKGFVSYDGPAQTLVNAYPKLSGAISRVYGSNAKLYQTEELVPAWENMLKAAEKMEEMTPQFTYDLADITRQVLTDISGEVYAKIKPAFDAGDKEETMRFANQMIQICRDIDEILATNKSFMIGTRLEGAKGRGVTQSDRDFYEQVERTFLTYWVLDNPDQTSLTDYCNRHLSGLMTDYYGMRWEVFADYLDDALEQGLDASQFESQMSGAIRSEIRERVVEWSKDHTEYPTEETGDTVEVSGRLYSEYQELINELYSIGGASRDIPADEMTATAGNVQKETGDEGPASNVLDGSRDTMWHTAWAGSAREEQWIDLALGDERLVDGLRYLPRQSGSNGIITEYEIYVSDDNGTTYQKVCEGSWKQDSSWKTAEFDPVKATNVRLQTVNATSDVEGKMFASAAEIRVTTPEGEYALLQKALEENRGKNQADYTEETWKVFEEAFLKAEEILNHQTAAKDAVLSAKAELEQALAGLVKAEKPNPDDSKPDHTNSGNTNPGNTNTQEPTIQPGKSYKAGNYYYQVTSVSGRTAAVVGLQKKSLKKLAIPSVVTLGGKQFKVTSIAAGAFKNNTRITSVVLKKNLEVIGANAFAGCTKLKKVTSTGVKLKKIGKQAFLNCKKLTKFTIKSKVLKSVGKNAFKGIHKKAVIKVPAAKHKVYTKLLARKGQGKTVKIKK